jgi:hypothetical protein
MIVQSGFEPSIVLHAVRKRVTDDGDAIAWL